MERLRVYNYEFSTLEELEEIVKKLNDDLNNEISQATGEKPFKRYIREKEYLRKLPIQDIFSHYIESSNVIRIVSKESLVTFDNRKYSVDPKYIGKTVTIVTNHDTLEIYFNKLLIQKHSITTKKYTYSEDDYISILKMDSMKTSTEDEIRKVASNNLKIYDEL